MFSKLAQALRTLRRRNSGKSLFMNSKGWRMRSLWWGVNRWLTWFHRWAGVVLGLLFVIWFSSGAVLYFVDFPALSRTDRQQGSETIDMSRVLIEPAAALSKVPHGRDLRLISVAGQPVYVAQRDNGAWVSVAADTGRVLPLFSATAARTVAERFSRESTLGISGPVEYDQWIVHQRFDPFRPFYRIRLSDAAATDLYVSARTGEVLQRTRFAERTWNWTGAVIHWIYFTPLRRSYSAWNYVVWWISLAALASSAVGTWLGVLRMASNRAAGRKGLSPFRGWMRWHHIMGLAASAIVVTWMLSGWLSMDHGRLFSRGEATAQQIEHLSGSSPLVIAQTVTLDSMGRMSPAAEIDFNALAGRVFITAYGAAREPRIALLDESPPRIVPSLPDSLLFAAVNRVWPGEVHSILQPDAYDDLYRRAESIPSSAAAFRVVGTSTSRVYVDRDSGHFSSVMDLSRRSYAWIYYALHTFQFPGLIEHPALRAGLVLTLLALGFVASVTGVVLSVKRLQREFA